MTAAKLVSGSQSYSLRRTKAAIIYEQTRNVEAVRELLWQSTISATSASLGVGKRQALEITKRIAISPALEGFS